MVAAENGACEWPRLAVWRMIRDLPDALGVDLCADVIMPNYGF